MATITIFCGTNEGYLESDSTTYANAASGTHVTDGSALTFYSIGQQKSGATYYCDQSFLAFDTTSLSGIGVLNSTVLSCYGKEDHTDASDFTAEARLYDFGAAITTADFVAAANIAAKTLLATFATSGFTIAGYNAFTESSGALTANLNLSGETRMMLSSDRQRTQTAPTGLEAIYIWPSSAAGTTNDPKIVVTYSTPHSVGANVGLSTSGVSVNFGSGEI